MFDLRAWKKPLKCFLHDRAGNVAMTFGLAAIPLVGSMGAAIDYSQANAIKAAMQTALDATALMLSRDATTTSNTDLQTKAKNYFLANFTKRPASDITISATYTNSGGSQVVVDGTVNVPTSFMGIMGINSIAIKGSATSKWGSERLRVALALDNTGSMSSDGKMTALKSATKSLLLQLKGAASVNGDVYVSIIPFSKDVNVGSSNYNASWIDWTDWNKDNTSCGNYWGWGWGGWGGSCTASNHNTWNGCISDRGPSSGPDSNNYDRLVTAPGSSASSKFPAEQYDSCPVEMKGLTYDWTGLNSLVDSMSPDGNTNQPIGLVWAWQSLVGGGPLTAPAKDSNYTYKEIIILMSDGLNTEDRWYQTQNSVDKRMYDSSSGGAGTCANIKAAGVTIYAIQVNTGGDPTSTIMQNCASSTDKFYEVKVAGDLGTVFSAIGTNLTKLRVAK